MMPEFAGPSPLLMQQAAKTMGVVQPGWLGTLFYYRMHKLRGNVVDELLPIEDRQRNGYLDGRIVLLQDPQRKQHETRTSCAWWSPISGWTSFHGFNYIDKPYTTMFFDYRGAEAFAMHGKKWAQVKDLSLIHI